MVSQLPYATDEEILKIPNTTKGINLDIPPPLRRFLAIAPSDGQDSSVMGEAAIEIELLMFGSLAPSRHVLHVN
jgi:hypothetical protein